MLNDERENVRKMNITVDVVQQELVDTVSELRREREERAKLEAQLSRHKFSALASQQQSPARVRFNELGATAESPLFAQSSSSSKQQPPSSETDNALTSQLLSDLVQQRVVLERIICALAYGEREQPLKETGLFMRTLLSSPVVQVRTT